MLLADFTVNSSHVKLAEMPELVEANDELTKKINFHQLYAKKVQVARADVLNDDDFESTDEFNVSEGVGIEAMLERK